MIVQEIAAGSRPRRLVFMNRFFSPDVSATSQLLTDLVAALGSADFEVHVVTSRQRYDEARAVLPSSARFGEAFVHRAWSVRFGRAWLPGRLLDYLSFYVAAVLLALHLTRGGDIIVALTDPPMLSVGAALVAKIRGARLVNWQQDVFPEIAMALGAVQVPGWVNALLIRMRDWSLRVAVNNIVLGERMRARLLSMRSPPACVQVIANWADGEAIQPLCAQRSALRRSLGPGNEFVVQYSGNLGRAHEFETILGAAQQLGAQPGWLFLMIGGGSSMGTMKDAVARLQLRNVMFLPYRRREELSDSLAAADVHLTCLLPDLEGLIVPSKLYGILAAGRPVIVIGDALSEQGRIVGEQGCGSVVRCGDGTALAFELRRMRSDPHWCRQAGTRARALFEQRYTLSEAAGRWRDVLLTAAHDAPAHTG